LRWKLLVITSLAAAVVGAGSCAALTYLLLPYTGLDGNNWLLLLIFLPPLSAIIYATIFVYRHTARRRKLQASLAALSSLLLAAAIFVYWFLRVIFHHD
jgi:hypothetical protein